MEGFYLYCIREWTNELSKVIGLIWSYVRLGCSFSTLMPSALESLSNHVKVYTIPTQILSTEIFDSA